ncbi:hypothetical protein WAI453_004369 [Rhynchosporium graminicola]
MKVDEEAIYDFAMKQLKLITDGMDPAWPCLSFGLSLHGLVKEEQNIQRVTSFMPVAMERSDTVDKGRKRHRDEFEAESSRKAQATVCVSTPAGHGYL